MPSSTIHKKALSGTQLAKSPEFIDLITTIQSLVALPKEHYTVFYQAPLEQFLAIYQVIPIETLQWKLHRVIDVLKLRRAHHLPFGVKAEDVREKKDIWTYSVFAAALLYALPDLTHYTIQVKHKKQHDGDRVWHPYSGAIRPGDYYTIINQSTHDKHLMSSTLLPILFDQHCIAWLYSDQDAFHCLLELIVSPDPTSTLGHLLINSHSPSSDNDHIGNALYVLLTEVAKGKIHHQDKIHNYVSLTHDGYAIAIPDIFNYYGTSKKQDAKTIETCFYALNKHTPSHYKVTFPNIGKKEAVLLRDIEHY